jgi:site-specific DNA-methyltransferase (adenine-specific)/adenine-specific DNA-methyltransferase
VSEGYLNSKNERIEGLGSGFRYCQLGDPLFDENGTIRKTVHFPDLARHVFFTETGEPLPNNRAKKSPLLGVTANGVAVYLLYNGILEDRSVNGGNILTTKKLALLPQHDGPKVVYAAGARLSNARLKRENITFKQTPYAIKVK